VPDASTGARCCADAHSLLPTPVTPGHFVYFTASEIAFLNAAVSRVPPRGHASTLIDSQI